MRLKHKKHSALEDVLILIAVVIVLAILDVTLGLALGNGAGFFLP